jgi:threonine dehydrogenase-like Zn-dependent dehydrogenase
LILASDRGGALREAVMAMRKAGTGVYGVIDTFPLGVLINTGITIRSARQPGRRYRPRMLQHVQRGELDPSFAITTGCRARPRPRLRAAQEQGRRLLAGGLHAATPGHKRTGTAYRATLPG